jgi:uncharacterized protein (DUF1330 family)
VNLGGTLDFPHAELVEARTALIQISLPEEEVNEMPAYLIADVEVHDQTVYAEYRRQVLPLVQTHGGRFIVRGGAQEVLEGEWKPQRLVVIEFPDMATLRAWYHSPEYAKLIALRQGVARGSLVAVEGV